MFSGDGHIGFLIYTKNKTCNGLSNHYKPLIGFIQVSDLRIFFPHFPWGPVLKLSPKVVAILNF
jgi:hypothetical protein